MKSYNDNLSAALLTFAANTSLKTSFKVDASRENGSRIKKIRYAVTYRGKTSGEGPLMFGICDSNLTVAELDECLDSDPQGPQAVPEQEESMRKVVILGVIPQNATQSPADIQPMRSAKWFWDVDEGSGLQFWVRNNDGSALTTGASVDITALILGEWLSD